jgi:hypothetical protein
MALWVVLSALLNRILIDADSVDPYANDVADGDPLADGKQKVV